MSVPRGVSTVCWGPELWQILHALSFCFDSLHNAEAATLASSVVTLLETLLPCHFCRDSWPEFVKKLEISSRKKVYDQVLAGTFARFLYDAHNLVNDKLMRQRWADVVAKMAPQLSVSLTSPIAGGVGDEARIAAELQHAADAAGVFGELDKRPTFECVQKRFIIAGSRPFSPAAVWRVLLLFSINFSTDKTTALLAFLRTLARCAELLDPTAFYTKLSASLRVVADALESDALETFESPGMAQMRVFERLALGQAACESPKNIYVSLASPIGLRAHFDALNERVQVAAAGACIKGVCK